MNNKNIFLKNKILYVEKDFYIEDKKLPKELVSIS